MKIFDGIRNPLVLLMSLIFCVTSSGCNTDYNTMVQEYNGCYKVTKVVTGIKKIGQIDEKEMISLNQYNIPLNLSFVIVAPPGGDSYTWTLEGLVKEWTGQVFEYVSTSAVVIGKPYELTLKVTQRIDDGPTGYPKTYTDKAFIVFQESNY